MFCRTVYSLRLSAPTVSCDGRRLASSPHGRLTLVILSALLVLGASRAEAGVITWHWAGPVTGYAFTSVCAPGEDCGPRLDTVVPLGTNIDVFVSLDPDAPPNANCFAGNASASLQVRGRTYANTGFVWVDGMGFGPGICSQNLDHVEVVVPVWGSGGPALPDGWVPFVSLGDFMPGVWWGGDPADGQPMSIASQMPLFWQPGQSRPQRFTANLQAVPANMHSVPEPATLTLFGAGLAAGWAARRRRRYRELLRGLPGIGTGPAF